MFGNKHTAKRNIVLIEDSKSMTALICALLKSSYQVKNFADVGKAWKWIKAGNQVDLIITDYLLPEINGLEFIEYLKTDVLYNQIPVVMITGVKPNHFIEGSKLIPTLKIIHKPFNPSDFKQIVNDSLLVKQ